MYNKIIKGPRCPLIKYFYLCQKNNSYGNQ